MSRHEWKPTYQDSRLAVSADGISMELAEPGEWSIPTTRYPWVADLCREILRLAEEVERLKAEVERLETADEAEFAAGQEEGIANERARIRRELKGHSLRSIGGVLYVIISEHDLDRIVPGEG